MSCLAMDCTVLEAAATRIEIYEAQRVPLLLQTPAYARALAAASAPLEGEAAWEREAQAVAARQQAILGERSPEIYPGLRRPVVRLVIGEAALLQQVGAFACYISAPSRRRPRPGLRPVRRQPRHLLEVRPRLAPLPRRRPRRHRVVRPRPLPQARLAHSRPSPHPRLPGPLTQLSQSPAREQGPAPTTRLDSRRCRKQGVRRAGIDHRNAALVVKAITRATGQPPLP